MATMGISAFILFIAIAFSLPKTQALQETQQVDFPKDSRENFFTNLYMELKAEWNRPTSRGYLIISYVLATACALSLMAAELLPLGYGGKFVEIHFLKDMAKVWYLFWPCILVIGLRRLGHAQQRTVFNTWLIAFGLLSLIGIFQYFLGWPRPQPIPGELGHFHATLFLGHHLSVASIFIFPFFATLDLVYLSYQQTMSHPQPGSKLRLKVYATIAILGFFALILTYSRTLWVALPLGIVLWILLTLPKKVKILSCIVLFFLALGVSQYPPVQRRLHDGIGIATRQDLWLANLEFLKQRPMTGVGWHHNQELSGYYLMDKYRTGEVFSGHAHNNFLDILGSLGGFGALAWLAWSVCVIWLLIRKSKLPQTQTPAENGLVFSRGLLCAWFVFQINGLTQVNFWEAKVEHQLAWVIAWSLL
jgi:O-antigen ligase